MYTLQTINLFINIYTWGSIKTTFIIIIVANVQINTTNIKGIAIAKMANRPGAFWEIAMRMEETGLYFGKHGEVSFIVILHRTNVVLNRLLISTERQGTKR